MPQGQGFRLEVKSLPSVWGHPIAPLELIKQALDQCAAKVVQS
jgi:hypothetical protein